MVTKETKNIRIYVVDNIKVDFVHYSCYPWLEDVIFEDGIRLASPVDIAAMKINAIEGRGTRKDFVDVFFLLKHYSLQEILSFYKAKYPNYSDFRALSSEEFSCQREQSQTCLSYAECSRKSHVCKMYGTFSISHEQSKLAWTLPWREKVWSFFDKSWAKQACLNFAMTRKSM